MSHRGPDGHGTWTSANGRVGLVHTRLSIIDLEGGAQPLANEDSTLQAVVNGEFYGFESIRASLIKRGHRFRTASDSEIVLHLYEDMGFACVEHLRGEFAFCLWDDRERRLWAVRDRFGIKPLFYARLGDTILIASEIKALFAAGLPARWDRGAVLDQLFVALPEDRTPYLDVRQVPPGHMLIVDDSGVRVRKYWEMNYPLEDSEELRGRPEEYIEEMRGALDEAVKLRLRADVPVGCMLSGGLDSSSVLGLASRHSAEPLHAFTVCFEDSNYNERAYASAMAEFAGAVFEPTEIRHTELAKHFKDALWHGEMFALNGHGVARYIHSKAIRDAGWKTVLSGSGSDDLLGGYPSARQDLMRRELGANSPQVARSLPLLNGVVERLGFVPSWIEKLASQRAAFFLFFNPEMLELFEQANPYSAFVDASDYNGALRGRDPVIQSLYLWTRAFLSSYELFAERLEMAHALETRLPFLDHGVFDVVRRMPVSMLISGTTEKYVLRQAMRQFLPDVVYQRSKHSFTAPPIALYPDSEFFHLLQDSLRSESFRQMPFFDQGNVIEFLDGLADADESVKLSLDGVMTMMLSASLLQELYSIGG